MKVLLCITGSVATVRIMQIVKMLIVKDCDVKIIRTQSSEYFWKDEWNEQLNRFNVEVFTDHDEWVGKRYMRGMPIAHIEMRKWADVVLIAPLTANTLAKIAEGISDNLVTCVMRAWDMAKPVIIAPAMNSKMWKHPITNEQLAKLNSWYEHFVLVRPVEKKLACGDMGIGGIADTQTIVDAIF
jgi:phosphopantothenoylcysteine decarboxylase